MWICWCQEDSKMTWDKLEGEVLSEEKCYGSAAVVLSNNGKRREKEKIFVLLSGVCFLIFSNEKHFREKIKELFCFHGTKK